METIEIWRGRDTTDADGNPVKGEPSLVGSFQAMVAAETDIPATDLGITIDNPASAEAMAEAERKTVGSYSESYSYSNPAGDLYLTQSDKEALGGDGTTWAYELGGHR